MVLSIRWAGRPAVRPSGLPNEVFPVLSGSSTTHLVSAYGAPAPLFHVGAGALAAVGVIERRREAGRCPHLAAAPPGCARRIRICPEAEGPSAATLLVTNRTRYGEGPEAPDPGRAAAQNRARDRRPDEAGPVPPPTRDGLRQVVLAPPAFRRANNHPALGGFTACGRSRSGACGCGGGLGSASRAPGG